MTRDRNGCKRQPGSSTNLLLHVPAIAHAAGLRPPTVDDWIRVNGATPRLAAALPSGPRGTPDRAGVLRGHTNVLKRLLVHAGGFNLGLVMRHLIGVGTPRGLQDRVFVAFATLLTVIEAVWCRFGAIVRASRPLAVRRRPLMSMSMCPLYSSETGTYTTGC